MLNDINRSPVNLSNSDKSFVSRKKSTPLQLHNTHKKSKSRIKSLSSSIIDSKFADRRKATTQLLHTQAREYSHSSVCNSPECSQCESIRYVLTHSYECQICSAKFYSNEQLTKHMQYNHRPTKIAHYHHRFRPYFKPFNWMNTNDQVPFFYPHLSLTPSMNQTRQYLHVDLDNHQ